jgi:hypothetical protein
MWISEMAKEAGVNTQTLRYYERRGLLPKLARCGSATASAPRMRSGDASNPEHENL